LKATEDEIDERRLIEAAQRDPGRFAEIYEANFARVYAYVARRVPGREEAEDVTAEVFQRALAGLVGFEWQGTPFIGWLLGIAGNLIARRWKAAGGKEEVPVDELELAANAADATNAGDSMTDASARHRQRNRELPDASRAVATEAD